jgi:hypothetical protein
MASWTPPVCKGSLSPGTGHTGPWQPLHIRGVLDALQQPATQVLQYFNQYPYTRVTNILSLMIFSITLALRTVTTSARWRRPGRLTAACTLSFTIFQPISIHACNKYSLSNLMSCVSISITLAFRTVETSAHWRRPGRPTAACNSGFTIV